MQIEIEGHVINCQPLNFDGQEIVIPEFENLRAATRDSEAINCLRKCVNAIVDESSKDWPKRISTSGAFRLVMCWLNGGVMPEPPKEETSVSESSTIAQ